MEEKYVGEVITIPYNFPPKNTKFCEGQLLTIADHGALYNFLGTKFGGDGIKDFALPDLRPVDQNGKRRDWHEHELKQVIVCFGKWPLQI